MTRLEEIQKRVDLATKGPWEAMLRPGKTWEDSGWRAVAQWGAWMVGIPRDVFLRVENGLVHRSTGDDHNDMNFISHAREDIPHLLSLLTEAREALEGLLCPDLFTEPGRLTPALDKAVKTLAKLKGE